MYKSDKFISFFIIFLVFTFFLIISFIYSIPEKSPAFKTKGNVSIQKFEPSDEEKIFAYELNLDRSKIAVVTCREYDASLCNMAIHFIDTNGKLLKSFSIGKVDYFNAMLRLNNNDEYYLFLNDKTKTLFTFSYDNKPRVWKSDILKYSHEDFRTNPALFNISSPYSITDEAQNIHVNISNPYGKWHSWNQVYVDTVVTMSDKSIVYTTSTHEMLLSERIITNFSQYFVTVDNKIVIVTRNNLYLIH